MGNPMAKSINLLLYQGDLDGVISIEDTSWNSGELYSAPRESVLDLIDTGVCNKFGVYLLLSSNKVYVGQSSDLSKRIKQHTVGKTWWNRVVILTTKDDSLNHADIDYLESILIEHSLEINKLDCDNKNRGNPPKVDKFRKVYLGQFLNEALFLMQLIGITVFAEDAPPRKVVSKEENAVHNDRTKMLIIGKHAKNEAVSYVAECGISLEKSVSYAVKSETRDEYWCNPNVKLLSLAWSIILNDNVSHRLTILHVPAHSIQLASKNKDGLQVRADKPERIALNIRLDDLVDRNSGINFAPYVVQCIDY